MQLDDLTPAIKSKKDEVANYQKSLQGLEALISKGDSSVSVYFEISATWASLPISEMKDSLAAALNSSNEELAKLEAISQQLQSILTESVGKNE